MKYQADGQTTKTLTLKDLKAISDFKRKYNTEDRESYASDLKKMPLVDLQRHAISVDVVPSGDRKKLEKRLLDQFMTAKANFDFANLTNKSPRRNISKEKMEKILKVGKYLS